MKWRVVLERDEATGDWAAWCPELPGCASAGTSEDEALENIREAIELYLEPDQFVLPPTAFIREVFVKCRLGFGPSPRKSLKGFYADMALSLFPKKVAIENGVILRHIYR